MFCLGFNKIAAPRWLKEFNKAPAKFKSILGRSIEHNPVKLDRLKPELQDRLAGVYEKSKHSRLQWKPIQQGMGLTRSGDKAIETAFSKPNQFIHDLSYADSRKRAATTKLKDGSYRQAYAHADNPDRGDLYKVIGSKKKYTLSHAGATPEQLKNKPAYGGYAHKELDAPDKLFNFHARSKAGRAGGSVSAISTSVSKSRRTVSKVPARDIIFGPPTGTAPPGVPDSREMMVSKNVMLKNLKQSKINNLKKMNDSGVMLTPEEKQIIA